MSSKNNSSDSPISRLFAIGAAVVATGAAVAATIADRITSACPDEEKHSQNAAVKAARQKNSGSTASSTSHTTKQRKKSKHANIITPTQDAATQVTQDDYLRRRYELEQRMSRLVGGATGMLELREMIRGGEDGGTDALRNAYLEKRAELEELLSQYDEMMREIEDKRIPRGKGPGIRPLGDEELYRHLIRDDVTDGQE